MSRSLFLIAQSNFQSIILCSVVLLMLALSVTRATTNDKGNKVVFQFPEYDYKENGKNVSEFDRFWLHLNAKKRLICLFSLGIVIS